MSGPPISSAEAKAVFDSLKVKSLPALARELTARGTFVSINTLRFWKRRGWNVASRARMRSAAAAVDQARTAARKVGLSVDAIKELEDKLGAMTDGVLVVTVTRSLLINAELLMAHAKAMTPKLMKTDPRGLAALYVAADRMVEGSHDLLREARGGCRDQPPYVQVGELRPPDHRADPSYLASPV